MVHLLLEQGEIRKRLAALALKEMPYAAPEMADNCVTVGLLSGNTPEDRLWGVALFHDFDPRRAVCEVSLVSWNPRWARKHAIIDVMAIPFLQYGCRKVYALTQPENEKANKWCAGIGFKREAVLRHHFAPKVHAVVYGMMRSEYDRMVQRYTERERREKMAA